MREVIMDMAYNTLPSYLPSSLIDKSRIKTYHFQILVRIPTLGISKPFLTNLYHR